MNDAKELREMIKEIGLEGDIYTEKTIQNLEQSADILIDVCKNTIKKYKSKTNYFKDAKEICISFETISNDFTSFQCADLETENKNGAIENSVEEEKKRGLYNLATYVDLQYSISHAKVPISGLEKQYYDKLLQLKEILEKRGFFCCAKAEWDEIYFTIVLQLETN